MSVLDRIPRPDPGNEPLVDLPLSPSGPEPLSFPTAPDPQTAERVSAAAPLFPRFRAFAADVALVVLLVSFCALGAMSLEGRPLRPAGFLWAAGFAVYLSLFTTIVPLVLFGRTVGLALAGLSAREPGSSPIRPREAVRRWVGTAVTAALLGLPLLWTLRRADAPTPADRLSGRSVVDSERAEGA